MGIYLHIYWLLWYRWKWWIYCKWFNDGPFSAPTCVVDAFRNGKPCRAVYYLWYSFLSTLMEANGKTIPKSTTVATSSTSSKRDALTPRTLNDSDDLLRTHHGNGSSSSSSRTRVLSCDRTCEKLTPLVGSTMAVGHSMVCAEDCVSHTAHQEGISSTATGAAVDNRSNGAASSEKALTACSKRRPLSLPPRADSPEAVRIPRNGVRHLPIFVRLGRGVPARPSTPPSCSKPLDGEPVPRWQSLRCLDWCGDVAWMSGAMGWYPLVTPNSVHLFVYIACLRHFLSR